MTKNQIDYLNFKESQRHNIMSENELGRHNLADEANVRLRTEREHERGMKTLGETVRHNVINESETARHNKAQEQLTRTGQQLQSEQIQATRDIAVMNNRTNREIASNQVALGYANLGETKFHNRQNEGMQVYQNIEQSRHNQANENEVNRHNIKTEKQGDVKNVINAVNAGTNVIKSLGGIGAIAGVLL